MNTFIDNLDLQASGLWFPILFGTVLFLFMVFMPKRLSWREILFTYGVIGYMTWTTDTIVGGQLDLFDLGDPKKEGIGELFTYGVVPSALAIIFLNYFHQDTKWKYVIFFTVLSFGFEWGLVQVGNMKLHGWRTWWSIPFYLGMYGFFLPWFFGLLKKEYGGFNNSEEITQKPKFIFFLNFLSNRKKAK